MSFMDKYKYYQDYFENELFSYMNNIQMEYELISEAMKYSLFAGGKRLRPTLLYISAEMLGVNIKDVTPFAMAIEMIHTYSLIHDDLPAMDNDDYRRGKPSSHKQFGEATAILAGDALLNLAYEVILDSVSDELSLKASRIIAKYAGIYGMVGGQVQDVICDKEESYSEKKLSYIVENKTSKLITAPLLVASVLSKNKFYNELKDLGYNLGFMFQLKDDILDVESTYEELGKTVHKDEEYNKFTSVKYYGIQGVKNKLKDYYEKCINILNSIPNSDIMKEYIKYIYLRTN